MLEWSGAGARIPKDMMGEKFFIVGMAVDI